MQHYLLSRYYDSRVIGVSEREWIVGREVRCETGSVSSSVDLPEPFGTMMPRAVAGGSGQELIGQIVELSSLCLWVLSVSAFSL